MYPGGINVNLGPYATMVPYGSLELTEASPPQQFQEPLDVEQVGSSLGLLDDEFAIRAAELSGLISAAREQAEIIQGRDLVQKQWDLTLDYWPAYRIELRPRLTSVDLVQYRGSSGAITTMVENTNFVVDKTKQPGIITPPYSQSWPSFTPWPTGAIIIRFTAGIANDSVFWLDSGSRVKIGMNLLISDWFSNKLPRVLGRGESLAIPDPIVALLSYGAVARVR